MSEGLELFPRPRHLERGGPGVPRGATATVRRDGSLPAGGYRLGIDERGVAIEHADDAGRRYALDTLAQLRAQSPDVLPGLVATDWPDFPLRGYLLDVSRDRVPTRDTLVWLLDVLATARINHLQLYTEHTFAYAAHEMVWRNASPLTPDDVRWLDAECAARGIELAANQNAFGHMERWLCHDEYRHLAEAPEGWTNGWGEPRPPAVLAPSDESAAFVLGLLRELTAHFTSRRINIGCDETFDLGHGRSAARVAAEGRGAVYLDFVLRLLRALHADGHDVQLWGDILRQHPELLGRLPRNDTTVLVWHYDAPGDPNDAPPWLWDAVADVGITRETVRGFVGHVPAFVEQDVPFWVCPGTSSWNSFVGRWENARANLLDAAEVGARHGARGYLITDWGDNGHLQPPSVSVPAIVYGGALAWGREANHDLDVSRLLDRLVFHDERGALSRGLLLAGGAYATTGLTPMNGSPLHGHLLDLLPPMPPEIAGTADAAGVARTIGALEDALAAVGQARPMAAGGDVMRREILQAIRLARHGAWHVARMNGFPAPDAPTQARDLADAIDEQAACWLLRSRPGGLPDSLARLRAARDRLTA